MARRNLASHSNCEFVQASVDRLAVTDASLDFAYSLGVLHHVPDTRAALRSVVQKLKIGAPFLVYLYYAFDNRPAWYRILWRVSEIIRGTVSRAPRRIKFVVAELIAAIVYWPLARTARLLEVLGATVTNMPLAFYRDKSHYVMRTDSLDRFGTRLEKRFTS